MGKSLQQTGKAYNVMPAKLDNRQSRKAELAELHALQTQVLTNYKDWAKEHVTYSDFDSPLSQQALKQSNDAYTMSMLTNCIMPYTRGITFESMLSSFFTHKMITTMNPSFDQDLSRMFLNCRDQLVSSYMNTPGFHPFVSGLNKYLSNKSSQMFHNQIKENMDNNTLDSMVMTPRQLAALKVNFMEQYYIDMRKCDPNDTDIYSEYDKYTDEYNTAMEHLNAIAKNSGFDMSVVAEEERYLVGLKIHEDPTYANMFQETSSMFGAAPALDADSGAFSGTFETKDGHYYTVGGNPETGAFTPRPPFGMGMPEKERKAKLADEWDFYARDCAAMEVYLKEDCPCSRKAKMEAKLKLDSFKRDFKKRAVAQLKDDFGMTDIQARLYVRSNFDAKCSEYMKDAQFSKTTKPMNMTGSKYHAFGDDCFKDEVNFAIDKELFAPLKKQGISPVFRVAYTDNKGDKVDDLSSIERDYQTRLQSLYGKLEGIARTKGDRMGRDLVKGRSGKVILEDMRNNYIESMTGDELFHLMTRAGNNCAQSYFSTNQLCGVRVYSKNQASPSKQKQSFKDISAQRGAEAADMLNQAMLNADMDAENMLDDMPVI